MLADDVALSQAEEKLLGGHGKVGEAAVFLLAMLRQAEEDGAPVALNEDKFAAMPRRPLGIPFEPAQMRSGIRLLANLGMVRRR